MRSEQRLCVLLTLLFSVILIGFVQDRAEATRLPAEVRHQALGVWPRGSVRLDGSISLPDGSLALPLMPAAALKRSGRGEAVVKFPDNDSPQLLFYDNGWGHIRCSRKGELLTVLLPPALPDNVSKRLATVRFPPDLIVPDGIVLPKSLKGLVGDLSISLADDAAIAKPEFGQPRAASAAAPYRGTGTYALISVSHGSIILLDGNTFAKTAEFPTEGTPCGMDFIGGKLYITDQAKHRILLLDPVARKFVGQIDLPPHTTPKGISGLPDGKWLYVSESGPANVAVIETATGKLLMKTKVPTGPGRLSMTPDGIYLLVLNVTSGELSIISTYNQRVVGTIKTGAIPTGMAVHGPTKTAYVSNRGSNTVSVIDIAKRSILNTIKTGTAPTGLALSKDGSKLYIACGRDNALTVFDTKTLQKQLEAKLPVDVDFPGIISLSRDGKQLLITSQSTDTVAVYDADTLELLKEIKVGHPTHDILWLPAG